MVLIGKANLGTSAADLIVGFQYSKSAGILPSNSVTVEGENADADYNYSTAVTGLEPSTKYYFRSFVRQNGQDTYGLPNILVVPHHGGKCDAKDRYYSVTPACVAAIISSGANPYHHPRNEIINYLNTVMRVPCIVRTDNLPSSQRYVSMSL
ncbi:MAG: hypothetical protein IJU69_01245 [Bacteroidales bacterium]|nr:hypothetical protein [Bacteroidales bacterium]